MSKAGEPWCLLHLNLKAAGALAFLLGKHTEHGVWDECVMRKPAG